MAIVEKPVRAGAARKRADRGLAGWLDRVRGRSSRLDPAPAAERKPPAPARARKTAGPRKNEKPQRVMPPDEPPPGPLVDEGNARAERSLEAFEPNEIETYDGRLLSGAMGDSGAPIELTAALMKDAVLLDNGVLLFDRANPLCAGRAWIISVARRKNIGIAKQIGVDLEIIRRTYEHQVRRHTSGELMIEKDTAERQQQFMQLVNEVAAVGGSDLHIIIRRREAQIRRRVDGLMEDARQIDAFDAHEMVTAAFRMARVANSHYQVLQYQSVQITVDSKDVRMMPKGIQALRLEYNPLPEGGRYLVCRLLPFETGSSGEIDSLGFAQTHVRELRRIRRKPHGIVFISGPTGSGKTTTLKKTLDQLFLERRRAVNILTIEDPPEYPIDGAVQLAVVVGENDTRESAFARSMRSALRDDPDIIMVGEVRDPESASLAFRAAMTGHNVYASVHANNAALILPRLRAERIQEYDLYNPELVVGLIGQRLVLQLCPFCRVPFEHHHTRLRGDNAVDEPTLAQVMRIAEGRPEGRVFFNSAVAQTQDARGSAGCGKHPRCRRGYIGRSVVAEIIRPDSIFMSLANSNDLGPARQHWIHEMGGITMLEHGVQKVLNGTVDPRDLLNCGELESFETARLPLVMAA